MQKLITIDKRFGDIAIEMQLISQEKFNRGMVVQSLISKRAKIHMPIGKVLSEMGLLTKEQVTMVLDAQKAVRQDDGDGERPAESSIEASPNPASIMGLNLTISEDQLAAFLSPSGDRLDGITVEAVKDLLENRGVVEGVVGDAVLANYLSENPLPAEPFQVACGVAPQEGTPAKILYHFDTDPMRIGTLKEDGSMDWKDRGNIPEVKAGDLLVEKVGGVPGKSGISVFGKELSPPRIKDPQLKSGKGAERSEDRTQILAKVDGTPKLSSDGRTMVFTLLSFDEDIGIETGNVDFDGFVETSGAVMAGFNVTAKGLRTREIQSATIRVEEDLVSQGGVYGSTITAGGNFKASHLHNCTVEIVGDLVVEKEIFGSTIEVNGRCYVNQGKIVASKISAKKGIEAHDIGSEAANPCELTVGIDKKFERDMVELKNRAADLEKQKATLCESQSTLPVRLDEVNAQIKTTGKELEGYVIQKRQFNDQLNGPDAVEGEEERAMLADLIAELNEMVSSVEQKMTELRRQETRIRNQLASFDSTVADIDRQAEEIKEQMAVLTETLKVDPGIAMIKATGTVFARTKVIGPHRQFLIQENARDVRLIESKSETGKWEFKLSNLR